MRYKDTARALLSVASQQGGYFTAQQALSVGYAYPEQHYHTTHGNWERVARGIYRLRDYPAPERDDLIILSLLSHDAAGQPQAVVSHETALALHDLSDANPARIHLTVPPGFRRQMPERVVLHRGTVTPQEREDHDGYHVTTPLRTLQDIAASRASWSFLEPAVRDALRRGLVRRSQILDSGGPAEMRERLREAVEHAEEKAGV